ncbi:MAG: hypothetical protein COA43_14780 [Robiginitomaculum sp.]|nr:MAG: hypothetical protein COA43_14780 [Robiginitomaculum sp.]
MSIILKASLATNEQHKRLMAGQFRELTNLRNNSLESMNQLLAMTINHDLELTGNDARTPEQAYLEFDRTSKIEQVPMGEHATLTRLLGVARSVNIGKEVFEYRKVSDAGIGQTSMSGQIGVKMDHTDVSYGGTVIPVHDIGFGRRWRETESMRADGYDALIDDSREVERQLLTTLDTYMWDGDADVELKGSVWLGIKADPSVASATIGVDLAGGAVTATDIRNEVRRIRDILLITNNCSGGIRLGISREIGSNWERVFSNADGTFGTIRTMIEELRGITEIYEDSRLVGNQLFMAVIGQEGFHPVVGMGMSTYMVPRQFHNSDYNFIKWAAVGFLVKTDFSTRTCALYGA